ncbi:vacuolar protein sorting-associated protein 16 homolog isoform X1 [Panthera uncia]|uniref:vacuolar protein sorting-associated protein 16 homolog isoform X1 n=1 Tax=Panthera uncia TaxID=29064 RepID=UPI0020FF9A10|nr:vacuolar protein sorting-associated protein 16 homolog isoform X1 [Panthera uncia]
MDCYTANWNPLGDSAFYRKYELYSMDWDLKEELRDCLVAAAPYGGPIALLRNPWRKEKAASVRPVLEIYSASGLPLASLLWKSGPVVSLGWSAEEELLCVQEDGGVLVYGLHGDFRRHFSMGNEVLQNRVLDARIFHTEFGSGVAILTGAHRFTLSANVSDLKLRRMPEVPGLQGAPSCWTALCQDRVAHILLAVGPDLYLLDQSACSAVTPSGLAPGVSSFLQMAVSFTYRHLALFTDTGYIWMGTASLKEKLCEFNCNIRAPPKQMVWCSRPRSKERAVVVAWERRLMVVGDAPESIQFVLDEDSYLVPELDGVRIFSRSTHEFLHEVPVASEEIFKIASMAPGALLLEAQKEYEKESQKADEYLREIQELGQLTQAVQQCIEAAGHEHRPDMQKSLLRAASFGKCFLDRFPPDSFVRMCQDLRVLNAIRDYHIGIPLTYSQYKQLTIQVLLDRYSKPQDSGRRAVCGQASQPLLDSCGHCSSPVSLGSGRPELQAGVRLPSLSHLTLVPFTPSPARLVLRRLYPLAIQICEYLRLPEVQGVSRILAHWACYKVQQKDVSDEDVARAINQKLGDTPGVSYSDIAARAYGCGRTELAIKLLEYEPRSGEQVPLLLKMKRSKLALSKAIESGDTDLVFTVLLHLKNELNRGDFFMTLRNQPMALSLYRQFCKHQELETLKDLYNQDDNHQELGSFHIRASYAAEERIEGRVAALQTAADAFYKAKNEFAAKATEDQMRLLRLQRRLEDELGGRFLDLSLHDTVTTLILGGHNKRAEQLARDFRIPDKRLWWLKLTALADLEDWEELEKFSKSKKSPIGYLPFVEICMKQHNKYEAKKYASRVGPEQKVKALLLVGDVAQAADVAIEHRNEAELSLVLSHCTGATDGATADKIQRARAQAQKK